jgi:hypothetical protein
MLKREGISTKFNTYSRWQFEKPLRNQKSNDHALGQIAPRAADFLPLRSDDSCVNWLFVAEPILTACLLWHLLSFSSYTRRVP